MRSLATRLSYITILFFTQHAHAEEMVPVKLKTLAEIAVYPQYTAPATVISLNESIISARIESQIDTIEVEIGDIVKKDDLLARLDCRLHISSHNKIKALLNTKIAALELAEKQFHRTQKLYDQKLVETEQLDTHQTQVQMLGSEQQAIEADLQQAQIMISYCEVPSPFDGIVLERLASVGTATKSGTPLLKIIDQHAIELAAFIAEVYIPSFKLADKISFAQGDQSYALRLKTIMPYINTETRDREVRLSFTDQYAVLGAAGQIKWRDPQAHIPVPYLVQRDGQIGIFTVKEQRADFLPIAGALPGKMALTSLPQDTKIVTQGQIVLAHGDMIKIVDDFR